MSGHSQSGHQTANPWLIAVTVTLAAFMEILDTTIVNVSLPHIAGSLSVSNDDATWSLTSYLVANAIVLTISGWLGRVFGRKRYFLVCIAMFTVFSFLCGSAQSLAQLLIFRALQGFFGGGLQPNQQAIILDTFPPEKRGQAFSVTAVATIVAPVLGPTLGGYITDNTSWRWIFFINVPFGLLAFFGVLALVRDPPVTEPRKKGFDAIGLGLITLGLGCLQVMLDRGEDEDWFGSRFIVTLATLAAIGIIGAVFWLLWGTRNPIVDLRALKDRNFAIGSVAIFAMASVLYSSAVLIPQLAQQVLDYDATLAGLLLSPGAALIIVLIPIVSLTMRVVQTRFLIMAGFVSLGLALVYSHRLVPNMDFFHLALMRATQVFGIGLLFVPISTLTYSTLPQRYNADGTALWTLFRNLAGSIGISLATAAVTQRTQVRQAYLADNLNSFNPNYTATLHQTERAIAAIRTNPTPPAGLERAALGHMLQTLHTQAQVLAYTDVFAACAIISFCIAPLFFFASAAKGRRGPPVGH